MAQTRSEPASGTATPASRPKAPPFTPVRPEPPKFSAQSTAFILKSAAQKHRFIETEELTKLKEQNRTDNLVTKSNHQVVPYTKKGKNWFFKIVATPFMAELEAAAWAVFDLIAPGYAPEKTNAYYDASGNFVGVSSQAIPDFKSFSKAPLEQDDLEDKELVRGMAIGSTVSHILYEEDYHIDNGNKAGQRVDFDGTLWVILGHFKYCDIFSQSLRPPNPNRYVLTEEDILHFPDLQGAGALPYYWLTTRPAPFDINALNTIVPDWVKANKAFPPEQNAVFKQLKSDRTFIYNKFKTYLKFLLINDHHYSTVIRQHMREEIRHPDPAFKHRKIVDIFADIVSGRKKELCDVLVKMHAFHDFINDNGAAALSEITQEIIQHNEKLRLRETHKREKNPNRPIEMLIDNIIDPQDIEANFNAIKDKVSAALGNYIVNPKL